MTFATLYSDVSKIFFGACFNDKSWRSNPPSTTHNIRHSSFVASSCYPLSSRASESITQLGCSTHSATHHTNQVFFPKKNRGGKTAKHTHTDARMTFSPYLHTPHVFSCKRVTGYPAHSGAYLQVDLMQRQKRKGSIFVQLNPPQCWLTLLGFHLT